MLTQKCDCKLENLAKEIIKDFIADSRTVNKNITIFSGYRSGELDSFAGEILDTRLIYYKDYFNYFDDNFNEVINFSLSEIDYGIEGIEGYETIQDILRSILYTLLIDLVNEFIVDLITEIESVLDDLLNIIEDDLDNEYFESVISDITDNEYLESVIEVYNTTPEDIQISLESLKEYLEYLEN